MANYLDYLRDNLLSEQRLCPTGIILAPEKALRGQSVFYSSIFILLLAQSIIKLTQDIEHPALNRHHKVQRLYDAGARAFNFTALFTVG